MGFIRRLVKQSATYWAPASTAFDQYGDTSFASPVAVTVRWETRREKFVTSKGDEDHSRAHVWSADTEFVVGGWLFLGTSVASDPETVSGADQIRQVEKTPDIRGELTLYKAIL